MIQSTDPRAEAESVPGGVGQWLRAHALVLCVSILVTGGFVWLLKRGALPVVPPRSAWENLNPLSMLGFTAAFFAVHLIRW